MRWSDERYVRLYVKDTVDWLALSFDAQALLALILRKLDRAGLLDLGKQGKRGVAAAIGHAHLWERLEPALDELLRDGCVEIVDCRLIMRNFIEAQETRQSDLARKRDQRERDRDLARAGVTPDVTKRDSATPKRHQVSPDVTPIRTVPSRAVPSQQKNKTPLPPKGPAVVLPDWLPADLWAAWLVARVKAGAVKTAKGEELSLRTLTRLRDKGHDPVFLVEYAIEHSWKGIYVPGDRKPVDEGPEPMPAQRTLADVRREQELAQAEGDRQYAADQARKAGRERQ